jgi:hypothetical protein
LWDKANPDQVAVASQFVTELEMIPAGTAKERYNVEEYLLRGRRREDLAR